MKNDNKGYTCTVHYSEDTSKRMTEALTELYYKMQKGLVEDKRKKDDDKTA